MPNYKVKLNHTNIIKCHKIFTININSKNYRCFVLDYLPFQDLRDYINTNRIITNNFIVNILYAVKFLHNNKIIHGDIKPENILCRKIGNEIKPIIIDYDSSLVSKEKFFITPSYTCPHFKKGLNTKSDLWSLGCIIFELFTHRPKFKIDVLKSGDYRTTISELNNINEPYKYVCYKLLRYEQEKRFKSVDEVLDLILNKITLRKKIKMIKNYII